MRPLDDVGTVADIIAAACAALTLIGFVAGYLWRRSRDGGRLAGVYWAASGVAALLVLSGGWVLTHWLTGVEPAEEPIRYTAEVTGLPIPLPRFLPVTGTLTPIPGEEMLWATAVDVTGEQVGDPARCTVTGGTFRCEPIDLGEHTGNAAARTVVLVMTPDADPPSGDDLTSQSWAGQVELNPEKEAA